MESPGGQSALFLAVRALQGIYAPPLKRHCTHRSSRYYRQDQHGNGQKTNREISAHHTFFPPLHYKALAMSTVLHSAISWY
jgi:hypothetical protein